MAGFWHPYADFAEARRRLCAFADRAVSPACGISYSDGTSIALVRRPASSDKPVWLHAMRHRVAAPPPPPAPRGAFQHLESWFENAMTAYGQAELQRSQMEQAAARAELRFLHDRVWLPAHQFLVRHKWAADGAAVVMDAVGVFALVGLVIAAPEVLALGAVAGVVAMGTGLLAGAGSVVLLFYDGAVFATEVSGHEALSHRIDDNRTIQWIRVFATAALVPDMFVGGPRALLEFGKAGEEATEAAQAGTRLDRAAEAQRARASAVRHPAKHPRPIQQHLHRAKVLARAAEEKRTEVSQLHGKMQTLVLRDLNASFIASPASGASLALSPPDMWMGEADKRADEEMLARLAAPEKGMPRDVQIEFRVGGMQKAHHQ